MKNKETSEIITRGIESGISRYQGFLSNTNEFVVSIDKEDIDRKEYRLVRLSAFDSDDNESDSRHLFPIIHFEKEFLESVKRRVSLLLVVMGMEIVDNNGMPIEPTSKESEWIESVHNLLLTCYEFETFFDSTENGWSIKAKSHSLGKDFELFEVDTKKKLQSIFIEKFLGFLFAAKDKSVTLAEGTVLNMCGCALYPKQEDENENENDDES